MSNKEIRFDVFENAELSQIEQLGIDENIIDNEAKAKMYSMVQKKYKKISSGTKPINNGDDYMDSVSGVKRVNKNGKSKIVMSVCGIAATLVLVIGGAVILNSKVAKPPVSPEPFTGTGTSTSTTTVTGSMTTGSSTSSAVSTAATATESTVTTTTVTANVDLGLVRAAGTKVLDDIVSDDSMPYYDIKYSYTDLNGDEIPELIVKGVWLSGDPLAYIYWFNDSEYTSSGETLHSIQYCPDNNYVLSYGKYLRNAVYEASSDNKLVLIDETDYYDLEKVIDFEAEYGYNGIDYVYNWQDPDFTYYAEHNAAVIDDPATLRINLDPSSLVSQGLLPHGDYTVCYQYYNENNEEAGGGVADSDALFSSETEVLVSRAVPYHPGRFAKYGIELYDNVNDVRISNLCIAEIDYKTEEINIISDRTNGAATFSFDLPEGDYE